MESLQYIGESLWQGNIGHLCIVLGFCSALFSAFAYFKHTNNHLKGIDKGWLKLARTGFLIHSVCIFSLIAILFAIMITQRFEYKYVFEHVSDDLPMRYIFSAFWEGQEGSFLLWMFWHIILGLFIMFKGGKWEAPVLAVLALIEVFINSMILGLHVGLGDTLYKLGSNPTLLLRETLEAPVFNRADYLEVLPKGTGLNPLLQNYWMTIHPPTLFLGFASVSIPFAYSIAGLWTKEHKAWLAPCLKWSLFSAAFLGTGIVMGGAWAYEALTFGGYWAWDPVENMSLVPWIIMVAGVHTNLIAKSTGYSIKTTYLLYMLSFVLILYSTFLTRSGILGDSSVHSFTEMGLEWQLVAFVAFFFLLGVGVYAFRQKSIPVFEKEETVDSREFWMYIGSLVLLFSGVIIASSTSLPVYNEIRTFFNPDFVGRVIEEPIPHFNKFQIWIAVFVSILSSLTLYLRYKGQALGLLNKKFSIKILSFTIAAAALTFLCSKWIDLVAWQYVVLSFCSFFAIVANLYYVFSFGLKGLRHASAGFSHFGFGLMIIGVLASGLNESHISKNPFAMKGLMDDEDLSTVIQLIKNEPMYTEDHWITYNGDTTIGNQRIFDIGFRKVDMAGNTLDEFKVFPNVLFSNDFKKVAATNPDTKHYLSKDIFTAIASLPKSQMDVKFAKEMEDSLQYTRYDGFLGDTIYTRKYYGIIKDITYAPKNKDYIREGHDVGVGVELELNDINSDQSHTIHLAAGLEDNLIYTYPVVLDPFKMKVKVSEEIFNSFFSSEPDLDYTEFKIKANETITYKGLKLRVRGFNKAPTSKNYQALEDDISVSVLLDVEDGAEAFTLEPIYLIRNMRPMGVKDYNLETGLHARFSHIDTDTDLYTIRLAIDDRSSPIVPIEIAENVPRSDLIVLEAKVFPGINLVWAGMVLMMIGFLIALFNKLRT